MLGTIKARPHTNTLAKLRVDAQLSPSAAAESLDIAEVDLCAIESGAVQTSTSLLADMARLYHASPHAVVKAYLAVRRT
jgi:DNA-binding XRE family transcriptional regulator